MRWGLLVPVLVGCGAVGEIDGFGAARRGFLVPCLSESGQPSAMAIIERRGRCVRSVGDLFPPISEAQCDDFTQVIQPADTCLDRISANDWELLSFLLTDVPDRDDWTGLQSDELSITPCDGGNPDSVSPTLSDADIVVVSDTEGVAVVEISSSEGVGEVELEVCR